MNFFLLSFVLVSRTGPHIVLHILFSKDLSLITVALVVVHTSRPLLRVGLIIAVYKPLSS